MMPEGTAADALAWPATGEGSVTQNSVQLSFPASSTSEHPDNKISFVGDQDCSLIKGMALDEGICRVKCWPAAG